MNKSPFRIFSTIILLFSLLISPALAAEEKKDAKTKEEVTMNDKELAFQKRLKKCILEGEWNLVEDGKMGPWKKDKYTIQSATKTGKDQWVIVSRVQFGTVDVNLPITVNVFWAGDTPVISVTDLDFPGGNSYTARVLVYKDTYAGSWFGKGYGGQMTGVICEQPKEYK